MGRTLLGAVTGPLRRFFNLEAASAFVLLGAALLALVWANSPFGWAYHRLFEQPFSWEAAGRHVRLDARAIVSDGLMTFFFFLAGMEIKREIVEGELRSARRALLPGLAALGGMVVPAALFGLLTAGTPGASGWGIPMATDIAFSLGALKSLGSRVPRSLIVFLTALAIFDDVGGILVIAVFYGRGFRPLALLCAATLSAGLVIAGRKGVRSGIVYALGGALLWGALKSAGVHPTIAGVMTGLSIPGSRGAVGDPAPATPLDRFIARWHPWVAFGIVPLFALSSSGVVLGRGQGSFGGVTLATAAALFAGKQAGVFGATFAAVKLGIARLPSGASWRTVYGVSLATGIGFTVALFMAGLAFSGSPSLLDQARSGIVFGSLVSAVAGILVLRCPGCRR